MLNFFVIIKIKLKIITVFIRSYHNMYFPGEEVNCHPCPWIDGLHQHYECETVREGAEYIYSL